ncbi:LamG domain-containing protein [Naegleria gruberi]|uniref:LamG domain-containing protein n=1 Tax=Naegleria gruberi TaxID=5762 RepID=D2VUA8_NAEGR|nr:LamG domain-containing protein [Naegleria gruberi]EFC39657.1 LamG domain-containing protein [Naegleria gruberi]|eukprot:XP_002672401.1 LamG domain-containing protein [Naegleria gruberi strain NEG-M]
MSRRAHQVSNSNFVRALFVGALYNDSTRQQDDEDLHDMNHSGINSVFEFSSEVNLYYEMKVPSEMMIQPFDELTMMAWVHPTKHGDIRIFDSSVAGENFAGFGFDLHMDKVRFLGSRRDDVAVGVNCVSSRRSVRIGEWNHCCVTFKKGEMRFYINGELDVVHLSDLKMLDPPLQNKLCIGYSMIGHPGSGYYEGFMSQMSVWNVALSDNHVEMCSRKNLLLLQGKGQTDSQFFFDPELYHIFNNHALIYLPYLKWDNDRVKNFGISSENLDIKANCPSRRSSKKILSVSNDRAKFTSNESGFDSNQYPVFKGVYWMRELHQHFSKEKRAMINLLLLIANRHAPLIGDLPGEVLEVVFSFLE